MSQEKTDGKKGVYKNFQYHLLGKRKQKPQGKCHTPNRMAKVNIKPKPDTTKCW